MFPAEDTPETIGSYRIVRRLASAGPAEVYLARSEGPLGFARECALKLLPDTSEGDASFAEELAREAAICGKLNHPAVVRVFDFFAFRGKLVLALEHIDGTTLAELMTHLAEKRQRLGDAAAYHVGARIAGAVADAHAARDERGLPTPIIHRNLTPENVLVSVDGEVRLTGFGLGKIVGRTPDTAVGKIKGTPGFMAPEQTRGEPVTPKADVYGLGLLVWSLLAGRRPPTDGTWPRRITGLRTDLPREVSAVVDAALDHFPGTRRISAREMEQWLSKAAPPAKGQAELKERVAELRGARAVKTSDPPPPARARAPQIQPPANPFQGVRFGAPAAPAVPRPAAARRAPAPATATAATATGTPLSRAVQNLPPPPPPDAPAAVAPVAAPRFGPAPTEPAPTPVEALPVAHSPPPPEPEPAPASARGQVLPLPSLLPLGAASLAAMLPRSSLPTMRAPPPLESLGAAPSPGAAVEAPTTPGDGPVPPSLLPLDGARKPLSAMGTIVVSAVTATVVVAAGLYLYVHRGSASPPALAVPAPATAIAAPAPPPAATVAPAASSAASDASAAPAPSADPADLPYGYGYLTVVSPASANVYLSGKIAGPVNQALKVRCGRWFVRLAAPPESRYPDWVSRGETVVVACQELTRLELSRRP